MKRTCLLRAPWALALTLSWSACGSGGEQGRRASSAAVGPTATVEPVRAGRYRLTMSATCDRIERTASGQLTLVSVSGEGDGGTAEGSALLWGQTDLDLAQLLRCGGREPGKPGEPIHPSVLVEVLRWDGERRSQVLLVSTAGSQPEAPQAGAGVAMWVESAERGRLTGVWSRWELMERGEGRWRAERVEP